METFDYYREEGGRIFDKLTATGNPVGNLADKHGTPIGKMPSGVEPEDDSLPAPSKEDLRSASIQFGELVARFGKKS